MDLMLMFITILLWSHLASSQSSKIRSSVSLQGGGEKNKDNEIIKQKELDDSKENEYEYEYLSDETILNSLIADDKKKHTHENKPTNIMSFTFDFYEKMKQFFVQMVENLDSLLDKIEGEEAISKGFHDGHYVGNDRMLTKHEDKGHRMVPARNKRPFPDIEKGCTAPSEQGNCNNCTKESPCKLGGGDCHRDVDCEGDLVCGIDNCRDFYSAAATSEGADCCKIQFDVDMCRANRGRLDDGNCDCDRDEDCYLDEVCGIDNGQHPNPSAPNYDSCKPCSGTESCPVSEGVRCDSHEDCKGILLCKVPWNQNRGPVKEECTRPHCIGIKGQDYCCTKKSPCWLHEGACRSDEDCHRNLMCGHRNCQDFNSTAQKDFNCCIEKNIVCGKSTSKTVMVEEPEKFSFKTQEGEVYKSNSECSVIFELGSSCAELQFYCNELSINNDDRGQCTKGDKLEITVIKSKKNEKTTYCQNMKPYINSTRSLNVMFKSERKTNRKLDQKKKRKSDRKKNRKPDRKKSRKSDRKKKRKSDRKKKRKSDRKRNRKSDRKKTRKSGRKKSSKSDRKKKHKSDRKKNRNSDQKKNHKSDQKENRTGAKCIVKCIVAATK